MDARTAQTIDLDSARKRYGMGVSKSAGRRRMARGSGVTHTGRPGQTITMSGGRQYLVAPDGSFRRIRQAA